MRSPYQELVFPVTASRGANVRADLRAAEKKARLSLIKDYIDYKEGRLDFQDYAGSAHFILNQLRESGSLYPEYHRCTRPMWNTWRDGTRKRWRS